MVTPSITAINQDFNTPTRDMIIPFNGFVMNTPVLPSLYWDVYSAEQRTKAICQMLDKVTQYVTYMGEEENETREMINSLIQEFHYFEEHSNFDEMMRQLAILQNVVDALPLEAFNDENTVLSYINTKISEFVPLTNSEVDSITAGYGD